MFALCDQRSFYASCEAVFRPDLRDKPICVLSNNDGCVVALNEYAKAVGVKKFLPYFQQRDVIRRNRVNVFSSNYALYGAISERIMQTLRANAPSVETYSIDEGFCFLGDTHMNPLEMKEFGTHLRRTVWREQRIPMGVSIGPTKTLAKLGQCATKIYPQINGVAVLAEPHQWEWLAARLPVAEVWGVGRRLTERLSTAGVRTALDLTKLDVNLAREIAGLPLARTVRELRGESCIPLEDCPPSKMQIVCSRSFGTKLFALEDILEAISSFAYRASEKLRLQDSHAGRLSVWLLTKDGLGYSHSDSLSVSIPGGTDDARRLSREAVSLVREQFTQGLKYVKAGVALTDIRPKECWQLDLLSSAESQRVMPVLDSINRKYGKGSVHLGRQAGKAAFKMKQDFMSSRYLTRWKDIPAVFC